MDYTEKLLQKITETPKGLVGKTVTGKRIWLNAVPEIKVRISGIDILELIDYCLNKSNSTTAQIKQKLSENSQQDFYKILNELEKDKYIFIGELKNIGNHTIVQSYNIYIEKR